MAYLIKGRHVYVFKARTPTGWKQLSTGHTSAKAARRVEDIWDALAMRHFAWDVLQPVLDGHRPLRELVARWEESAHQVPRLRELLAPPPADPDVAALVSQWLDRYAHNVKADTADHALQHIRWLLPEGRVVPASTVTVPWLDAQLHAYPGKRNTRRKVHSSWTMFFEYVTSVHRLFQTSPMLAVGRPRLEASPIMFYEQDEVEAIVGAQPTEDRRSYFALVYGTGCDVSTALRLRRMDVDDTRKELRAPGTKAYSRDRVCRVAEWAWPILAEHLRHRLPTSLLFPAEWNRWTVSDWHRATVAALQEKNVVRAAYPLRNSRDHWAVRAIRGGAPAQVVAAQLGHGSPQLVLTKYGRFQPGAVDRDRWEEKAVAYEVERRKARQA